MKKIFTALALLISGAAFSQNTNVGIGTTNPDNSAILDLSSSNKGFLMPRMTEEQRLNIATPAQGLQVFQSDSKAGVYTYDGLKWVNSTAGTSAAIDPWLGGGNAASATDFIGTTNNEPLRFKVNNIQAGFIGNATQTNLFLGYNAGKNTAGLENVAIGNGALFSNVDGRRNIAIGSLAMTNSNSAASVGNIAIGRSALGNNSGTNNLAIGISSMTTNTSGSYNVAFGYGALNANSTGNSNVAIGNQALLKSTGTSNAAIGGNALVNLTSGGSNFALGTNAGFNLSNGSANVFIGSNAGYNETGSNKLYISSTVATPSPTDVPLIYGDFSAKYVTIGDVSEAQRNQGVATGGYNLLVKGGILTEKVKVALASSGDWADYVFEPEYSLLSLEEVEKFTKENKHLPNVPSADEMAANGLDINETSKMFMEKIEELTLYIIDLNKQIQELKK